MENGTLLPLSSIVLLFMPDPGEALGYFLTDGRRWVGPYPSGSEAMDDQVALRQLTFGEEIDGALPSPRSGASG